MSEKILNTRIQLRYDSFNNWKTPNDGRGALLKKGELAVVYLAETKTTTTPDNGTHPVMFKVGPGYFNELPWASALAADVFEWAKNPNKPTYDADEIKVDTADNHFNGKALDAALAEIWTEIVALTGGEEGAGAIADQIKAGIKAIKGDTAATGSYVTGVSIDENGNLKVSEATLPESATSEQGDKADSAIQGVKVNGVALTPDSNRIVNIEVPTENEIKNIAATEINTLIDGANDKDTITNINTLISYVNENGEDTSAIMTELYGSDVNESRIDKLEAKAGLDKVGTVTSVTAGTGLTGGIITEAGTIALDDEYVKGIKVNAAGNADKATDADKLGGTDASEYLTKTNTTGYNDIFTKTDAQETITKASEALQTISAGTGLKVEEKANNNQEIGFDPNCVFIFDCGDAFGNPLNTNN